jgi:hypothetical protein
VLVLSIPCLDSQPASLEVHFIIFTRTKKKNKKNFTTQPAQEVRAFSFSMKNDEETEEIILLRKYVSFFVIFRRFFSRF